MVTSRTVEAKNALLSNLENGFAMAQRNKQSLVRVLDRDHEDARVELIAYLESLIDRAFTGNIVMECQAEEIRIYETPRGKNRINSIHRWPHAATQNAKVGFHNTQMTVQHMVDELRKRWLGSE